MKKLIILFFFAINLNLFASDPSSPKSGNLETYSISGKVIEHISGESLTGVEVEVVGTDISVYSNFDGEFEIDGLKPGVDYTIRISYVSYKNMIIRGVNSSEREILVKLQNDKNLKKNSSGIKNPLS